jgi:AraC family transcriptional regulator of adaptative response/methylated-DNA-[protein]-cysteine methyltransferase
VNDFERIAQVIRHLDEHHLRQPDLAELATVVGLSESHFHRLFHRWAGITPKDFLQCLTLEHARLQLLNSASVLDAALNSGLSGPGRLHDLIVTLEAATPGECKNGGLDLNIEWGEADSPFGICSLAWTARGICHLAFHNHPLGDRKPPELLGDWPNARLHPNPREARRQAKIIFNPERNPQPPLKAWVRGTDFQLKVWRALIQLPESSVISYGSIARVLGVTNAARAIGTACGANPIAYLIPCHRVIRATGGVRGYRWGSDRKRILLAREAAGKRSVIPALSTVGPG